MKFKVQSSKFKVNKGDFKVPDLINVLLENRGIKTKREVEEFLNPDLKTVTAKSVGINSIELKKAIARIKKAIKNKEQIVVFGDYDVDGICGTAILWETLNSMGAKVMPYIPHRIDEGYGLSIKGIQNVMNGILKHPPALAFGQSRWRAGVQDDNAGGLIITVDNGIVANKAVEFANRQGIDVIITDHHVPSKTKPKALAIVHTVKLCGTGVAWLFSRVILNSVQDLGSSGDEMLKHPPALAFGQSRWRAGVQHDKERHLELVALATVADLVPLKGANRTLLKFGLEALGKTKRVGLLELFKEAALDPKAISVYEIGHMIAPRLNAMGRLEYAMDSLRLICTNNKKRAEDLARLLGTTNKERQSITLNSTLHAIEAIRDKEQETRKLLFISHESYEQGVIGLIAGKLVEEFYRPAIVVSKGKKFSKASARSISGFNIIEFIREHSSFLVDAGGHPMAAGFTVETSKLIQLQKALEDKAELSLSEDLLTRSLRIDCELSLSFVDINLYESLQKLSPFGMGNPEPTFLSKNVLVEDVRLVGKDAKHLKLRLACHPEFIRLGGQVQHDNGSIEGIGFGMGDSKIHIGDTVDIVYTIAQDEWLARRSLGEGGNGEKRLQLKIKDIKRLS